MVAGNFNFLANLSCKVHFENLDEFIDEHGKLSSGNQVYRLNKFLLQHDASVKFDVILAWDFLNYLPLEVVEAMFVRLNAWCQPNTLMHSIGYLGGKIPEHPARFEIIDQYHVNIRARNLQPRRVTVHQTAALLKRIPDYYLHNHLMNEKGMVRGINEHVMRFQPDNSRRKQFVSSTEIVSLKGVNLTNGTVRTASKPLNGEKYRSPAIRELLTSTSKKNTLLDLGSKSSHNLDFWRSYFHEVYTEDLASSLRWQSNKYHFSEINQPKPISDEALKFDKSLIFDTIIFWDALNFCDRMQLTAIGERLGHHCRAGTKIVLFSYLGENIPEYPLKFELISDSHYRVTESRKIRRESVALTTAGIMKLVPGWRITSTHIFTQGMKPGVVELIFEQMPAPTV